MLYDTLDALHEKHPAVEEFTLNEFRGFATSRIPLSDKITASLLASMDAGDISGAVIEDIVTEVRKRALANEICLAAIDVSEGRKDFTELLTLIKSHDTIEVLTIEFITDDLEVLYDEHRNKPGLRWRLQTLNEMLGSLRRGDFGFIFARPESGKTTFLASEVSYFAQQSDSPILWFNNEEDGKKVQRRIIQATLGYSLEELYADIQVNRQKYYDLTGGRIKLIDSANIHKRDVEVLVAQYKPALVVFDQIDKIKGFVNDREDLRLGAIYVWAREIAKEHCPVIGVCQADATGEGKAKLGMENIANSKTSKAAEADFILGIGKRNTDGYEYSRTLTLSKNKLDGDADSVPELRHGSREVIILPEIGRYQDIK